MREDCFGYHKFRDGIERCGALWVNLCEQKECPFYKTPVEYVKGFEGHAEYKRICRKYGVEPKK